MGDLEQGSFPRLLFYRDFRSSHCSLSPKAFICRLADVSILPEKAVFRGGAATTIITHTAAMLLKRALQPIKVRQTNAITICWLQIPPLLGVFDQVSWLS